ncbi:MAG TPA: hypothetical protein PLM49_00105, partial [Bacteroidales bacterium]|nr:hypothetical protein [Bacteroidales bacterium]
MKNLIKKIRRKTKKSFGHQSKKSYLIIKRSDQGIGLGSYILTNLGQMHYAFKNGMTPVIDMQSYLNSYLESNEVGKCNAWEFYFKQPAGIGLSQISLRDCETIDGAPVFLPYDSMDFLTNDNLVKYWQAFTKENLKLTDEMNIHINKTMNELFVQSNNNILGVLCRGTDYINTKPYGHPVQPSVYEVIAKAEEVIKTQGCSKVFLATEDASILNVFKECFKEKLIFTNAMRYGETQGKRLTAIRFNRERDKYFKGLEYLESIVLLSRCQCMIAGRTNGS